MKKIFLFAAVLTMMFSSCKKKANDPSIEVTVSFPVITFYHGGYFSIPVGGSAPTPAMIAVAYDTFYQDSCTVVLLDSDINVPGSSLNTSVPGLYQLTASAINKYGFPTFEEYYVAVTSLPSNVPNITGNWQMGSTDSFNTTVTSLTNGYYSTSNFYGVNLITNPGGGTSVSFALINDSTIAFVDPIAIYVTSINSVYFGQSGTLSIAAGDTTMSYNSLTFTRH